MGSLESGGERTVTGWAAQDASGVLAPFTYTVRNTGAEDVVVKVIYCGICHTDLHQVRNDFNGSSYPMVPGHEVVGEVVEVGCGVTKFRVGDKVGVGCIIGSCNSCSSCESNIEQYCRKKIWTYNDVYHDGKPTQGGFASTMVVNQKFVVHVPHNLPPEQVAPLLCAGITVYSPLKHFGLTQSGLKCGILGLGGVGHMGVKIAKAFGHHVTVISSSDKKKKEAMEHLGADAYLVSSDQAKVQEAADSLDYIIDTIPAVHPLEPYLSLLKVHGRIIMVGVIPGPLQFVTPMIMLGKFLLLSSRVSLCKNSKNVEQLPSLLNLLLTASHLLFWLQIMLGAV
ncbi:unnamed protein product [Victoria cruziana]